MSARVVEEGDDVVVAARSSTIFSSIAGISVTKLSLIAARTNVAIRRKLSCVLRSASSRADVAPTPNTIPAVVGGSKRERSSGTFSLSLRDHCFNNGSHSLSTSGTVLPKNRGSLNASPRSFFHDFCVFGSLDS